MTSLNRAVRRQATFTVVRVRRIKRRAPSPVGPRPGRKAAQSDLSDLII